MQQIVELSTVGALEMPVVAGPEVATVVIRNMPLEARNFIQDSQVFETSLRVEILLHIINQGRLLALLSQSFILTL